MVLGRVCLWFAFALVAASAWGQPADIATAGSLEERVKKLEERINQLEQALASAQKNAVPAMAIATPRNGASEDKGEFEKAVLLKLTKFDALDQQVRVLTRLRELDVETAAVREKETPKTLTGGDGFGFKSAEGDFQLNTGGYLQADGRAYTAGEAGQVNTFLLRRVRPVLQGTLYKFVNFRVMPDFGQGKAVLQDAYLELNYFPNVAIRAGKFKPPLGLERLQSATDLRFIERGLPTGLVPNRDVGVQVGGDLTKSRLSYALGIFNGTPDGASVDAASSNGKDFVARLFGTPFPAVGRFGFLNGLGAGFAVSAGTQQGALPTFATSAQSTFFTYANGATASGGRRRYSPQAFYYRGPFGLLAEFVRSSQMVAKSGAKHYVSNYSWQMAGSYLLTREKESFKRLSPMRDFDVGRHTWGAWELVARIGQLNVDPSAFALSLADPTKSARRARAWAAGVNWYLNRNVKIGLDYERTSFAGGAAGGGDRDSEGAVLSRFQLGF